MLGRAETRQNAIDCPDVLLIQLKRFDNSGKKIMKKVTVEKDLAFPYAESTRNNNVVYKDVDYKLHGIVSHHGKSLKRGHYTAQVQIEDKIFDFDDENVEKVRTFNSADAYIVMYIKVCLAMSLFYIYFYFFFLNFFFEEMRSPFRKKSLT